MICVAHTQGAGETTDASNFNLNSKGDRDSGLRGNLTVMDRCVNSVLTSSFCKLLLSALLLWEDIVSQYVNCSFMEMSIDVKKERER